MSIPFVEIFLLSAAAPLAAEPPATPVIAVQEVEVSTPLLTGEMTVSDAPVEAGEAGEAEEIPTEGDANSAGGDVSPAGGDVITVVGQQVDTPGDPLEQLNATTFQISQSVDRAFVEPVAQVYEEVLPGQLRSGLRNFLRNLLEPVNFINGLLQFKPKLAAEALGRFALNSTLGLGGLFDVAKLEPFGMEFRRNGFSNTLGYYGVGPGSFLVLPLVGATTVRDLIGSTLDQAIVPFAVGPPLNTLYYGIPAYTINSLEFRVQYDERYEQISSSDDPYAAMRESYLCGREADIAALHGQPPPRDCAIDALMAAMAGPDEDEEPEEIEAEMMPLDPEPAALVEPVQP